MTKRIGLLITVIILLFNTGHIFAKREKMRIAILDLQPAGVTPIISKTVSDLLRTELHNTGLFQVIERGEMNSILKEQAFQKTGCTETECAVQMGRLLSARKILVGTVSKLGKKYIINARIVDVEKGVMEFADKARSKSEDDLDIAVEDFARKIAFRITKGAPPPEEEEEPEEEPERIVAPGGISGAGFRSALLPGWGQFYTGHNLEGFVSSGSMLVSAGLLVVSWLDYSTKLDEYEDLGSGLKTDEYKAKYQAASDAYDFRTLMLGITAVVYSLNILDASFDEIVVRSHADSSTAVKGSWILGSGLRSAILPGWGQFYSGHDLEGFIFSGAMVLSAGGFVLSLLDYNKKLDEYEALGSGLKTDEYKEKYKAAADAYSLKNTMLYITAAVYGLNILDALFDGVFFRPEKRQSSLKGSTALSAGLRSAVLPGWGQIDTGYKAKGYIYMGLTLLSGGGLVYALLDYNTKLDEYEALDPGLSTDEYKEKYEAADSAYKFKNIMLYATVAIYSVNIIDALFCGTYSQLHSPVKARGSSGSGQRISLGFSSDSLSVILKQSF